MQAVSGSSKFSFSFYVTGLLVLMGVFLGRFICGFLCPFGWFQELLHKVPSRKLSTEKLKPLRYFKYVILLAAVFLLPAVIANAAGLGDPYFCKYICPQGVLEGALRLALGRQQHQGGSWEAVHMESEHTAHGDNTEHHILPTVLQMAVSARSILCTVQQDIAA